VPTFKRVRDRLEAPAIVGLLVVSMILTVALGAAAVNAQEKHFLIYLSMSYIGNDWQPEAKNMITALAQTAPYNKEVTLRITVAGTNVERQIAQINSAVAAHANGIIMYPISPTALNATVERACAAGVKMIAYDSVVTAPCAYNVTIHQHYAGHITAQWLAEILHGKGNIVMITGVPGTSVDLYRTAAAEAVFKKYPGIHVIAKVPGYWAQAPAKDAMSKILISHPASTINGIWVQVGCYAITQLYLERHYPLVPCAGEQVQGHLFYMLPKSEGGVDLPSISYSATNFTGALAFKQLVRLLNGAQTPKITYAKFNLISNRPEPGIPSVPVKLCTTGSAADLAAGCNVFPKDMNVPPGFFNGFYSPEIGLGLTAALTGSP
jgi:ribose transport system substrate-binding protein